MHFLIFGVGILFPSRHHCGGAAHAQRHGNPAAEPVSWLDPGRLVRRAPDGDLLDALLRLLLSSRMVRTGREPPESDLPESELLEPRWALRDWIAAVVAVCGHGRRGALAERARRCPVRSELHAQHRGALRRSARCPTATFPWRTPPLTFLIQAAIIRLTGRVFFHHVLYVALIGGLGTVLTWRIALASLRGRIAAAWTGGAARSPRRSLSSASTASCQIPSTTATAHSGCWSRFGCCGGSMQRRAWRADLLPAWRFACRSSSSRTWGCRFWQRPSRGFAGARDEAPPGRGKPRPATPETRTLLSVLAGACVALGIAVLALHWTAGIGNYVHWTIEFAGAAALAGTQHHARRLSRSIACCGRCPALWLPSRFCGRPILRAASSREGWDRNSAGRASSPLPCSPRRFSSRSPHC